MTEGLGRDGGHAHPGSASLLTEKRSHSAQAGLLTDGSSYSSSLPAGPWPTLTGSDEFEFRPRSQWRDRDGFAPSSLFSGLLPPPAAVFDCVLNL